MTDIEIKQAINIALSDDEKLKRAFEEIFQKMSLKKVFEDLIKEEAYHGIYLRQSKTSNMYSLYDGEFAQDGKYLGNKKMLVSH